MLVLQKMVKVEDSIEKKHAIYGAQTNVKRMSKS